MSEDGSRICSSEKKPAIRLPPAEMLFRAMAQLTLLLTHDVC